MNGKRWGNIPHMRDLFGLRGRVLVLWVMRRGRGRTRSRDLRRSGVFDDQRLIPSWGNTAREMSDGALRALAVGVLHKGNLATVTLGISQ
jgi:hypothetical protein